MEVIAKAVIEMSVIVGIRLLKERFVNEFVYFVGLRSVYVSMIFNHNQLFYVEICALLTKALSACFNLCQEQVVLRIIRSKLCW